MKKTTQITGIVLTILLAAQMMFAQTINTQGVLRDANGYSLDDGSYSVTFRIYDAVTGGTLKWNDTYDISVTNGVFSVTLGDDSNPIDTLSDDQPYWIGIEVGSDGEMSPRLKLSTTPYEMNFLTGNQNKFPGTGNVGIGTLSPPAQLSLGKWNSGGAGSTNSHQLLLSGAHNSGVNAGGVKLQIEGYDNDGDVVYPIYLEDENNTADFWIKNKPSASGLSTAYFQGNVGIGESTPKKQLTINSAVNTAALSIGGYLSNGHWTGIQMGYGANDADKYHKVGIFYKRVAGYALGSLIFATDNTSDDSNVDIDDARMTITSAGKVGIGTTSPGEKLDVDGNIRLNGTHLIFNSANGVIDFGDGSSTNGLFFRHLSTQGDIDNYTNLAHLNSQGGFYAIGGFHTWSDIRLKSNVKTLGSGLSKALKLKPVEFEMKDYPGKTKIGFIANDVQKVIPELVTEGPEGYLAIEYGALSTVAIAAIQEQQKIIDRQEQKIDELEKRLARIETSLGNK